MNDSGTRLLLIRHAHVDTGTSRGRMCGWLDLPLSPKGRFQVRSFSHHHSGDKPRALYTSPLLRARATAEALAQAWELEPDTEPALREINCGAFEGMDIDEIRRDYRELWDRNTAQNDGDFAWPGGESYRDFRGRILAALTRIAALHADQSVAVVTHTGVITQVIGVLENLSPAVWERYRPAPFSATEVLWRGDTPERLLSFNLQEWWRGSPRPAG
jgi:broad specificity phosphatase PhoE